MQPVIDLHKLKKVYKTPLREEGLIPAIKNLFSTEYKDIVAVDEIDFSIYPGEIVGFIGPNGAGKTTTLKMLAGILYPSSGSVQVMGCLPWEREIDYLKKISMVMGNKSQLNWDITVLDSLYVLKEIYQISDQDFNMRLQELSELLEIEPLFKKQARNLSLGERAKCELTASLIHQPEILFLDEPTLGLDVTMQIRLRNFIKEYNQKYMTTILLSSHYMADISSLCSRVILIYQGKIIYDGDLSSLAGKIAPFKIIKATIVKKEAKEFITTITKLLKEDVVFIAQEANSISLRVRKEDLAIAVNNILNKFNLIDLTIDNPPIEVVMDQVFQTGGVSL